MNKIHLQPHHVTISVKNLDQSISWYSEKLGLVLVKKAYKEAADAHVALMILNDSFWLELIQKKNSLPIPLYYGSTLDNLNTQGLKSFAFGVRDVDEVYKELMAKGVVFTDGPTVGSLNHKYAIFKDNNGIPIEIFEIEEHKLETKWSITQFLMKIFNSKVK